MNKLFSKTSILLFTFIIISGGIFSCQTGWTLEIEDKTAKCSQIDFSGYELAENYELEVDLNNDGEKEIVRAYRKPANDYGERMAPIMVKIYSGAKDCPKEVFSYYGKGNFIGKMETFSDFWEDGSNSVLIEDIGYGGGCGSGGSLLFLNCRQGKYSAIEGPPFGGYAHLYIFNGENGLGKKIIVAKERWSSDPSDYCCGCARKLQFIIYTWDGKEYAKTEAGITQNKYLSETIEDIIQKEPEVLKPVEEKHG